MLVGISGGEATVAQHAFDDRTRNKIKTIGPHNTSSNRAPRRCLAWLNDAQHHAKLLGECASKKA